MTTIVIDDQVAEVLSQFGDVQEAANRAVKRYTLEQIADQVENLRRRNEHYEKLYGIDYPSFSRRIAEDASFVLEQEAQGRLMWENDLLDWEFCHKGVEDWNQKLNTILMT